MTQAGQPDEITVLLRILDIIEGRLLVSNDLVHSDQRRQVVQVRDSIVEIRSEMSDNYTVGQAGAVGRNAKADNVSFQQIWQGSSSDIDVAALTDELKRLRVYLRQEAETPEQDESVAAVSKAQAAASDGDGPRAVRHLSQAGKWALAGATSIGTTVAAAALKAALGI